MAEKYTVVKGDDLWDLAEKFKTTVDDLLSLNKDITDPNYIVEGQELVVSGEAAPATQNLSNKTVAVTVFGLQSNADRTLYITWSWSVDNTDKYEVKWYYDTGDKVWFVGTSSSTEEKQAIYNAPSNAKKVKVKIKPIAKTYTSNNKEVPYWEAKWSTDKEYDFDNAPPSKPPVPNVEIVKDKLTAKLDNLDVNATTIEFQVVKNNSSVFATGPITIKTGHVTYSCDVNAGSEYKVRCRAVRGNSYSDWTEYSANVGTRPSTPGKITELKALSETSISIVWEHVANAETYTIEYTTQKRYFDSSSEVKSMTVEDGWSHAEITGLEIGQEYFFRVRAVNGNGESGWTDIKSLIIGKDPAAPTTWSSTTTAITGEALSLYWVHNSEDGSKQTYADLELYINGVKETHTIEGPEDDESEEKTSVYAIDTSEYTEGTTIQWRVRTAGITKKYGDWSVQRTVDIYAPPTVSLNITDSNNAYVYTLTSFPIKVRAVTGPNTQAPLSYHLSIVAEESYETVDNIGNLKMVSKGEAVYSRYFDLSTTLSVTLSAHDVDLENNVRYTVKCVASMNSGLTASSSSSFKVGWVDVQYDPNASISIDKESYTASIMPYCSDLSGVRIDNVTLAVYRREYDGGFTLIADELNNEDFTFVTDPHPALDFARYRVVATSKTTGAVSYYDVPGVPVNGDAAIIQWDEVWTSFNALNEDEQEQPTWSGSMLKLPYNIGTSDKAKAESVLVEYMGRKHPVSYYGTQQGIGSNWTMDVPKEDKETIYALRRLSLWRGDVYVREPSGSGYWANITVSFNMKHDSVVVPVTLDITRVEGGV